MNKQLLSDIEAGPLWVFTAARKMEVDEITLLRQTLTAFLDGWTAHGHPVISSYEIVDNTVVIIAADQNKSDVTGCSKDKLNHLFLGLGNRLKIDFFNRMLIPVFQDERIRLIHWNDIEQAVESGELTADTLYIDGSLHTVNEMRSKGFRPIKDILVHS